MKIICNLPFYSPTVGGINTTIQFAKELGAEIRFQSVQKLYPQGLPVPFTVGKADSTFPACDVCITYSDDPFAHKLTQLPQIKRVACYFQSYGMSIYNERLNSTNPNILNLCSTQKIEQAISREGYMNRLQVHNIGFGLDIEGFVDYGNERKNYLAIMYHDMPSKKYDIAVQVADILYAKGIIEGVLSFGTSDGYKSHKHPKGLVKHYSNATRTQVAEVFNQCKAYLMPSVSEGLNLTPIESTLCGCPAVICDGAIGEIFKNGNNCYIVGNGNTDLMIIAIESIIKNNYDVQHWYKTYMQETIKPYTWANTSENLMKILT